MATPNIVPRADSEGQLGTSSKYWAAAYIDFVYVGAGKIGRDADNYIDFSVDNKIKLKVEGVNEYEFLQNVFRPITTNGAGLGDASHMWSDLFLASGAVINFDNSNVTLTHSSNQLTLADGDQLAFGTSQDLQIYHDGTHSYVSNTQNSGNLIIQNSGNDHDIVFNCDDGSGGVTPYITLDGSAVRTKFNASTFHPDGIAARFGNGEDLKIYHNGTGSFVENVVGDLTIFNNQDDGDIEFKTDNGGGGLDTYLRINGTSHLIEHFKSNKFYDNVKANFGASDDLQIYHDATNSVIHSTNGTFFITNTSTDQDIKFNCDDGAGGHTTYFYLDGSSATHDGSATTALFTNWPDNSKISLGTSHDLKIYHEGTDSVVQNDTGDLEFQNRQNDGDIVFKSDDGSGGVTAYLTLDGGETKINVFKKMEFQDNVELAIGSSEDLKIDHNATNSRITNYTGDLIFANTADDKDIIFQSDDGSGGVATYLTLDGGEGYTIASKTIRVNDSQALCLGTGLDLQLNHDGTNSNINNFNGNLSIVNFADDKDIVFGSDDGSGGAETYFFLDGSAGGANPRTIFPDNSRLCVGSGEDLNFSHDATDSYIQNETGDFYIKQRADDKDIIFQCDDGSGGTTAYLTLDGGGGYIQTFVDNYFNDSKSAFFGNDGDLRILHDGSNATIQNNTGNLTIANRTDDGDIIFQSDDGSGGVATYFFLDGGNANVRYEKSLFLLDNVRLMLGSNTDLQIYHDASNSYIDETGTGSLFIRASDIFLKTNTSENAISCASNGSVELYHNNAKKLETTATGALVTGFIGVTVGVDVTGGNIDLVDNSKIRIGTSQDLRIYHDASNSFIENYTGDLKIINYADDKDIIFFGDDGGGNTITALTLDMSNAGNAIFNAGLTAGDISIAEKLIHAGDTNTYIQFPGTNDKIIFATNGSDALTISADNQVTSSYTTGTAEGAGIDASNAVSISVGSYNSEIITNIFVDLGAGSIVSTTTDGGILGNDGEEAPFITRITKAVNGVVYRGELICLEAPNASANVDIDLSANSSGTLAAGADGNATILINSGGAHTVGRMVASTFAVTDNDFLYLTQSGTTNGTYGAGKLLIKLYGAKTAGL